MQQLDAQIDMYSRSPLNFLSAVWTQATPSSSLEVTAPDNQLGAQLASANGADLHTHLKLNQPHGNYDFLTVRMMIVAGRVGDCIHAIVCSRAMQQNAAAHNTKQRSLAAQVPLPVGPT